VDRGHHEYERATTVPNAALPAAGIVAMGGDLEEFSIGGK
jgi:hypothetical protein